MFASHFDLLVGEFAAVNPLPRLCTTFQPYVSVRPLLRCTLRPYLGLFPNTESGVLPGTL